MGASGRHEEDGEGGRSEGEGEIREGGGKS